MISRLRPFQRLAVALAAALAFGAPLAARSETGAVLTFGLGPSVAPAYPGSDDYEFGAGAAFRLNYFNFGGVRFGSSDPYAEPKGLGLRGSFRYLGDRSASDHPELTGLNDIDTSVEIGLGLGWEQPDYRVFGDLRYGAIGHESFVGEIGADWKFRPSDDMLITFGPRARFGSDKYNATYFGVTPAESLASGLPAYAPDGGMISGGLELGMKYRLSENWGVEGRVNWNHLTKDAAGSPITGLGSEDQFGAKLLVTRRITFGF